MTSAREVAVFTLAACEKQGAWSDGHLKKMLNQAGLERRDAALATRLCFGVLQNQLLLDFYLSHFSKIKLEKLEAKIRACLRIALYQLLMMDKIPPSAAVDQSVSIARKYSRNPRAPGLVNAVLRAFLRAGEDLPPIEGATKAKTLSLRYSHPLWLVEEWIALLGEEETRSLLEVDNEPIPTVAQVNCVRASIEEVIEELEAEGVSVSIHPWLSNCFFLSGAGDLERLSAYRKGMFYIQDAASRLAVESAGLRPGDRVLDCCAAPGGKSFAAAIAMENRGEIVSCDIHPHKIKLIRAGLDRLGLTCISPIEQNARIFVSQWERSFDVVLADVPCSGLGIIRKKPDIRFKKPGALEGLPQVQRAILDHVSHYVRPGGTLLYSTCTLRREENEENIQDFLSMHQEFVLEAFALPGPIGHTDGMITLWPHIHSTDGFFIAKLRRKR